MLPIPRKRGISLFGREKWNREEKHIMNTNLKENTTNIKKTEQEQDGYTYPYIPKKIYPAVMYACKLIRKNGFFNKAVRAASRYYGVDKDAIIEHVRKRISAGVRAKHKPFHYKYFVVEDRLYDADRCIDKCLCIYVKRAKAAGNIYRDVDAYAATITSIAEGSSRDGYESLSEAEEIGRKLAEGNDVSFRDKTKEASRARAASRTINSLKRKASQFIKGQGTYGQLTLVEVDGKWTTYENETGIGGEWYDGYSRTFRIGGKSRSIVRKDGKYNIVDDSAKPLSKIWFDSISMQGDHFVVEVGGRKGYMGKWGLCKVGEMYHDHQFNSGEDR